MRAFSDSLRGLLRSKEARLWLASGILSLALLVGANAPYPVTLSGYLRGPLVGDAGQSRLVRLWATDQEHLRAISYPDLLDWRNQTRTLDLAGMLPVRCTLMNPAGVWEISGESVSASYFPLLGVRMASGRVFRPEEEQQPEGAPVVIVSHSLWQAHFGGSNRLVGSSIMLGGRDFRVVGIAPPGFGGLSGNAQLWIPLTVVPSYLQPYVTFRGARWVDVVGRLKPGVSVEEAQAEMDAIARRLASLYPSTNSGRGVRVESLTDAAALAAQPNPATSRRSSRPRGSTLVIGGVPATSPTARPGAFGQ